MINLYTASQDAQRMTSVPYAFGVVKLSWPLDLRGNPHIFVLFFQQTVKYLLSPMYVR